MQGDKPLPFTSLYLTGVSYTDLRQLDLAITPHAFLGAALAAKHETAITLPILGAVGHGPLAKWAQSDHRIFHYREVAGQCRPLLAASAGCADAHSNGWDAYAP